MIKTQITTHDYNQNDVIKNISNKIKIFPFGIQKSKLKNSAKSLFTDINIAISNQPHSEVAALTMSLYEYFGKDILTIFNLLLTTQFNCSKLSLIFLNLFNPITQSLNFTINIYYY